MKKIFLIIISLILVSGGLMSGVVSAQMPQLPNPGITPESPFYFLDRWGEGLQDFFTFNLENKAHLQTALIAERISEIKVMLGREIVNKKAIETGFERISGHQLRMRDIIQRIDIPEKQVFVVNIVSVTDSFKDILGTILEENKGNIRGVIALEKQRIEERLNDPVFVATMEGNLRHLAARVDEEVGRPLSGFDEFNIITTEDIEGDTYTATKQATAEELKDLTALRTRILAGGIADRWESGDVVLDDDSLDITFEKIYNSLNIEGETMFPYVSVTISITLNSPETGMTAINYDIDITLEGEFEYLLDFLEKQEEKLDDDYDVIATELEGFMNPQAAAERRIRETEKEAREIEREKREAVLEAEEEIKEIQERLEQAVEEEERREIEKEVEEARQEHQERLKEIEREKRRAEEGVRPGVVRCQTDVDCRAIFCPMAIGMDTPRCDVETRECYCGPSDEYLEGEQM